MIYRWLVWLSLLLLQGCSAIKLGYQQLPTLSYWWLDSAVSFSDAQSTHARQALESLHHWHRREELPAYADLLQRSAQWSQGQLQGHQVCAVWSEAQAAMDRSMREAIRHAAPVAMQLGPKQLSHLAHHFERKNEEWEKEWLQGSLEERQQTRLNKTVERYASFYGELNAAQVAMLKSQQSQSAWSAEWGRQDRQRRQQDLLATLKRISQGAFGSAQAEQELHALWQRWLKPPDAHGQMVMATLVKQTCENLARLHNTTTPEQRQRAVRRLRSYERDLKDLIQP